VYHKGYNEILRVTFVFDDTSFIAKNEKGNYASNRQEHEIETFIALPEQILKFKLTGEV
jgi:hypothetical protein